MHDRTAQNRSQLSVAAPTRKTGDPTHAHPRTARNRSQLSVAAPGRARGVQDPGEHHPRAGCPSFAAAEPRARATKDPAPSTTSLPSPVGTRRRGAALAAGVALIIMITRPGEAAVAPVREVVSGHLAIHRITDAASPRPTRGRPLVGSPLAGKTARAGATRHHSLHASACIIADRRVARTRMVIWWLSISRSGGILRRPWSSRSACAEPRSLACLVLTESGPPALIASDPPV